MQAKRVHFPARPIPYLLLAPQIIITLLFFIWPAAQAVWQSTLRENAFGTSRQFVGFNNFAALLDDPTYLESLGTTVIFSLAVAALSMVVALLFALGVQAVARRAEGVLGALILWPYAVAPALAGVLWWFVFDPTIGVIPYMLEALGYDWNHNLSGTDALVLVVLAASWKQISYNFIFFLAGLIAIPRSLIEAAAIDGAGPGKRFWTITLPLLSPVAFFLLVVNTVYALFETFAIIHATTGGGPARATNTLVYKVYADGFVGLDLGGSAAQSVVLMAITIGLTVLQFRYIEKKVSY